MKFQLKIVQFLALAVFAVGVAFTVALVASIRHERAIVDAIRGDSGSLLVRYDWEPEQNDYTGYRSPVVDQQLEQNARPAGPAWLRAIIGNGPFEHVDRVTLAGADATEGTISRLVAFPQLRVLRVPYGRLTASACRLIGQLATLESLDLSKTTVSDAGVQYIGSLPRLRNLSLADTTVGDDGLRAIAALTNLENLDLCHTRISDGGVALLSAFPALRDLNLQETRITDGCVGALSSLTGIRELRLGSNTRVDAAGIDAIRKALPKTRID